MWYSHFRWQTTHSCSGPLVAQKFVEHVGAQVPQARRQIARLFKRLTFANVAGEFQDRPLGHRHHDLRVASGKRL